MDKEITSTHPQEEHTASIPDDCIAERAYEIYVRRGSKGGQAEGDWLTAETELKKIKKKAAEFMAKVESLKEKWLNGAPPATPPGFSIFHLFAL